ncbi:MAG TPA: hypothetical protein VGR57_12385 [Ktedonobacterales bacterium]|nr:hypothetical protein [Ktedonobacterales bacterium]
MARSVIIHLVDQDPVLVDMEELPTPNASCVFFTNPRRRDGKPVGWVTPGAVAFVYAMTRINFIEVMTSDEERDKVVEFYRNR